MRSMLSIRRGLKMQITYFCFSCCLVIVKAQSSILWNKWKEICEGDLLVFYIISFADIRRQLPQFKIFIIQEITTILVGQLRLNTDACHFLFTFFIHFMLSLTFATLCIVVISLFVLLNSYL